MPDTTSTKRIKVYVDIQQSRYISFKRWITHSWAGNAYAPSREVTGKIEYSGGTMKQLQSYNVSDKPNSTKQYTRRPFSIRLIKFIILCSQVLTKHIYFTISSIISCYFSTILSNIPGNKILQASSAQCPGGIVLPSSSCTYSFFVN